MKANNSPFNKQNELIRSLRKQLQATERELADQKWLFQQFLNSPSWRLTYPIRWLARQFRAIRDWILGRNMPQATTDESSTTDTTLLQDHSRDDDLTNSLDLKGFFTELYRIQLQSFLSSGTTLDFPEIDNPEISVLLVLFNRAELTLACLRSLIENRSERIEVVIADNNSQDETPLLLDRLRGVRIIRNAENRHFLLAINQIAKQARGDYLLILNNDAQV